MNTMTCAITAGCLVLLVGTCFAAETEARLESSVAKEPQMAEAVVTPNNAQLRAWLDSIKPAAGQAKPVQHRTEYWQQSVRRENRGHMQE